jgi:hypothetical protein
MQHSNTLARGVEERFVGIDWGGSQHGVQLPHCTRRHLDDAAPPRPARVVAGQRDVVGQRPVGGAHARPQRRDRASQRRRAAGLPSRVSGGRPCRSSSPCTTADAQVGGTSSTGAPAPAAAGPPVSASAKDGEAMSMGTGPLPKAGAFGCAWPGSDDRR